MGDYYRIDKSEYIRHLGEKLYRVYYTRILDENLYYKHLDYELKGGWVSLDTIHEGGVVLDEAKVFDCCTIRGIVSGKANVHTHCVIDGIVRDKAIVMNYCVIDEDSQVLNEAEITMGCEIKDSVIRDNAMVREKCRIVSSNIRGQARVTHGVTLDLVNMYHDSFITEGAKVTQSTLFDRTEIIESTVTRIFLKKGASIRDGAELIFPKGYVFTISSDAKIGKHAKILGNRFFYTTISKVGSEQLTLTAYLTPDDKVYLQVGCWDGYLPELQSEVERRYHDEWETQEYTEELKEHWKNEYTAIVELLETKQQRWIYERHEHQ